MKEVNIIESDVLVLGGGIAGIRASIEASKQGVNVVLANKGYLGQDGAAVWMAGGGYQAALYPPDSVDVHAKDTINAGKYLNNQKLVYTFLSHVPESVDELAKWGIHWKKEGGKYAQIRMPGQSVGRCMLHTKTGEHFGGEYRRALPMQVRLRGNIKILNEMFIIELLKKGDTIVGALGLDIKDGKFTILKARATILATGGFMDCFKFTTANPTLTGDGQGMAYRAGASMTGMEFIQFFPAACLWPSNLYRDAYPYGLIYELYGILFNKHGERFMERYYPVEKDFVPREAMSRAIAREVREGRGSAHGGAYLSFRHMPKNLLGEFLDKARGNLFFQGLREAGLDITEEAIEIGPAAHYVQGGCWINQKCETDLEGLYAAGEVGSGGKDGADRLAGNALPFCMGMGFVAGREAAGRAKAMSAIPDIDQAQVDAICSQALAPVKKDKGVKAVSVKNEIRDLMSSYMQFDRKAEELEILIKGLEKIRTDSVPNLALTAKMERYNLEWIDALEVRNMLDASEMATRAALMRTESRGLHERADYPGDDPGWFKHVIIKKDNDRMGLSTKPVSFDYTKPPADFKA